MTSTTRSNPLLDPSDIANLEREGTLSVEIGWLKLHKRRFNRSSDAEYEHLPIPPSTVASDSEEAFVMIPYHLSSDEALQYIGFTDAAAAKIWQTWLEHLHSGLTDENYGGCIIFEMEFTDHIHGRFNWDIQEKTDCTNSQSENDDEKTWRETMDIVGIRKEVQERIMTPCFKRVRQTQSCKSWILDTVLARYKSLLDVQAASLARVQAERNPAVTSNTSLSLSRSILCLTDKESTLDSFPLYRSGYPQDIHGIFDNQGNILANHMLCLASKPGDFNNIGRSAIYTFADLEVAKEHAGYAKKRIGMGSVAILCLEMPHSAIRKLDDTEFLVPEWSDGEYSKLVGTRRQGTKSLPPELEKFDEATVIRGPICGKLEGFVTGGELIGEVRRDMLVGNGKGELAVQYAFMGGKGAHFLGEYGRDFKIYKCTEMDMMRGGNGWEAGARL